MNMNTSRIAALIFTAFIAGALSAAETQRPESAVAASTSPTTGQIFPDGLNWLTDFQKAQARAKVEGKSVLLFFHGSDWCPTCAEMQRQVFDSPAFAQYARQALVLVD